MSKFRIKGTAGPLVNRSFDIGQGLLIGRADDCGLRIDLDGVAPHHCAIRLTGQGGLRLETLDDSAETRLNGEVVHTKSLASGDEIRIGAVRFLVQAPGLRPERVLTEHATRRSGGRWRWWALPALAALAGVAWYWWGAGGT